MGRILNLVSFAAATAFAGAIMAAPDGESTRRARSSSDVKQDLILSNQKATPGKPVKDGSTNLTLPARIAPAGGALPTAQAQKAAPRKPVEIELKEGDVPEQVWNDYFASHQGDDAPDTASVREKARELMREHKFAHVIAMINAALQHQQGQPWMFEGLALAMQADQRSQADVERALMSALDFVTTTTDMMYLAHYMARSGLEQRALQLFRQASELDPTSPEPYAHGLRLAQRLDDLPGIQWAVVGILSQAWPNEQKEVWDTAYRVASATLDRLQSEHKKKEAKAFKAALDEALVRDCVVIVSWTGDADVDLMVEEPSGTICSFRFPRTTAGGLMLGDAAPKTGERKTDGASEVYVCPKGFDGTYRVMIRRVWGKLAANKVTLDIYWHYFSKAEKRQTKQIELTDDVAVATFDVAKGRRKEPLDEHQVALAAAGQMMVGGVLLAQQLNALNDPQALGNFLTGTSMANAAETGFNPNNPFMPFGPTSALGYQPVISTLPKGAMMMTSAVVSADRRYVRVSPSPLFSGVTEVNTFNYVTGSSGTSNGAGGGGFGAGGGAGGLGGF
jgi:hypothetical protein